MAARRSNPSDESYDSDRVLLTFAFADVEPLLRTPDVARIISGTDRAVWLSNLVGILESGDPLDSEAAWLTGERFVRALSSENELAETLTRTNVRSLSYGSPLEIVLSIGISGELVYLAAVRLIHLWTMFKQSQSARASSDTIVNVLEQAATLNLPDFDTPEEYANFVKSISEAVGVLSTATSVSVTSPKI